MGERLKEFTEEVAALDIPKHISHSLFVELTFPKIQVRFVKAVARDTFVLQWEMGTLDMQIETINAIQVVVLLDTGIMTQLSTNKLILIKILN